MRKMWKRIGTLCLLLVLIVTAVPARALADGVEGNDNYTPYLALGADLKPEERETVLKLLNVTEEEIQDFDVIEVTNEEEREYLGEYLAASVIGSRALSSVLVVKQEDGYGITVETANITYCTEGMYRNALITAGIENAKVSVAGPFSITGTAALIGAMQAYTIMTGQEISKEAMDTAINELVLTGELTDTVKTSDSADIEKLMAMVKQKIAEGDLKDSSDIKKAIEEAAGQLNLKLTEEQMLQVQKLMGKISGLDLSADALKEQAKDLYNSLKDLGFDMDASKGFFAKLGSWFSNLFQSIADFFTGLFD